MTSEFTPDSTRNLWNRAAAPYAAGQAAGLDHYRYEFFGPAQVAMCGDVSGLRVLDVGCGSGYFAREIARRGAHVTGVDIAPRMIEEARAVEARESLGIDDRVADAAILSSALGGPFDLVTSCVALQDMPDTAEVFRRVFAILRPGGRFVPSITHPATDTPFRRWERDERGEKRWLCVDRYFEEVTLTTVWGRWEESFTTQSHHSTLETWFGWILGAGFHIAGLREPRPTPEALDARPDLSDAARVPYYLMFDLAKPR